MKKVAIAIRTLQGGTGASAIILNQIKYFSQQNYIVDVYSYKFNTDLIKKHGGNPIKININIFAFTDYQKRKSFANKFELIVKQQDYNLIIGHGDVFYQDILFMHNTIHLANKLVPYSNNKKIFSVGKIHDEIFAHGIYKICIANSYLMQKEFINRYKISTNNIKVIYPALDLNRFNLTVKNKTRDISRHEHGIKETDIVIGLISSGDFQKRGVDIFLQAINKLSNYYSNLKFVLVGKEKNINLYFDHLNINSKQNLVYYSNYDLIENLFFMLDIFILPSYLEEFGLVVSEAIASGVVSIVGSNVGANEKLTKYREHIILNEITVDEVINKLTFFIDNPNKIKEIANFYIENYKPISWNEYFDQTII